MAGGSVANSGTVLARSNAMAAGVGRGRCLTAITNAVANRITTHYTSTKAEDVIGSRAAPKIVIAIPDAGEGVFVGVVAMR